MKNLKIFKTFLKCYGPYALVATTLVVGGKITGSGLPFIRDKEKIYAKEETIYEEDNIIIKKKYSEFIDDTNYLEIKDEYEYKDNLYQREVYKYDISDYDIDINKILNKETYNYPIIDQYREFSENKENDSKKEIHIFTSNDDDYIYLPENYGKNMACTTIEVMLFIFSYVLLKERDINFQEEIEKIKKLEVDKK